MRHLKRAEEELQYVIVVIRYRIIDKNLRKIVNSLRDVPFIKEIIFYRGEKSSISVNNYKIWEEGSNLNPIEEVYDAKILELTKKMCFPACG